MIRCTFTFDKSTQMNVNENLLHQMTQELIDAIGKNDKEVAVKKLEATQFYLEQLMDYATTDEALVSLNKYDVLLKSLAQKIK
jgi:hypothetical protein